MRFLFFLFLVGCINVSAQHKCSGTEMQNNWFKLHPELKSRFDSLQKEAQKSDKQAFPSNYAGKIASSNYTIPVVFHILHMGGIENISDAQAKDAIDVLNRDFNKLNADTTDVVFPFNTIIGNAKFEFRLATKDPNGNCTNGIIRHLDKNTDWKANFTDYAYTWNPTRYLNVYVVLTIAGGSAAYTFLPGTGVPTAADAIVIRHDYLGSIGNAFPVRSRTLTHEVGHWFGLSHLWGNTNQPGVSCGDDGVSDTPVTKGFTGCFIASSDVCTQGVPENLQNHMDYSYCTRMFTIGQTVRMNNSINSAINGRNNLSTAINLSITGVTHPGSFCVPLLNIKASPSTKICSGKPISLSSYSYNTNPNTYWWSCTGAIIMSPSTPSTNIIFPSPGIYTVNCQVANGNGSSTQTILITVNDGLTQVLGLKHESFEDPDFQLPQNWTAISPSSPTVKWVVNNWSASKGEYSMLVEGESIPGSSVLILESPSYDFKNSEGANYTFKYAYAKSSPTNKDVFKVQVSKDCGGSWSDVFTPDMDNLASASGGISANLFFPIASQWVLVDLKNGINTEVISFMQEDNVRFRFYFMEDAGGAGFGNRFYLDEVNFNGPVGIKKLNLDGKLKLEMWPNPAGDFVNLKVQEAGNKRQDYIVQIKNLVGQTIMERALKTEKNDFEIHLDISPLSNGVYFIELLSVNEVTASKKFVVNH